MLRTALNDLLHIEHPILQGGMAWVATWELVAAVSRAGGLGILGAGNAPVDWVRDQVRFVRASGVERFGVNVPLFSPSAAEVIQLCIDERVPVVTTGAGNPAPFIEPLHTAGALIIPVVSSVALARRLEQAGADALIAEGEESGGHVGTVSTVALVPQVVDAVRIPVIAAGGLGDGRGLAAALALGAAGIQMGTRFICTQECAAHANYKAMIVQANERATIVTGHSLGHPVRCLRNPMAREFERLERSGATEEEIVAFGGGRLRAAVVEGDTRNGSVMAGQISGLVRDIPTVAELVQRTVREAEAHIQRLNALRI